MVGAGECFVEDVVPLLDLPPLPDLLLVPEEVEDPLVVPLEYLLDPPVEDLSVYLLLPDFLVPDVPDLLVEDFPEPFLVEPPDFLVEPPDFLVEPPDFLVEPPDFLVEPPVVPLVEPDDTSGVDEASQDGFSHLSNGHINFRPLASDGPWDDPFPPGLDPSRDGLGLPLEEPDQTLSGLPQ